MKNNEGLQHDVQEAIKRESLLNAAEIGVIAQDGIITITGTVDSYAKKRAAEHAAKTVPGVLAVVEQIEVKFGKHGKRNDLEIALELINVMGQHPTMSKTNILVKVEDGCVTLEGDVDFYLYRETAQKTVEIVKGVKNLINKIQVNSKTTDAVEKKTINDALIRNWAIDEKMIKVDVFGNKVTLSGMVNSIFQRDEAERLTWNAPGVWTVHNELLIDYATI